MKKTEGKVSFTLKPVTPKSISELKKLGVVSEDGTGKVPSKMMEIAQKPEDLKHFCEIIFDNDFKDFDFENIDLGKVGKGFDSFLNQFLAPIAV